MKAICPWLLILALAHDSHVWGAPAEEARARAQQKSKAAVTSQQADSLQLVIELLDGSRIVGIPSITSLPLQTSFAKMDIPLKHVGTVEFADDRETVKVSCTNGDVLQGSVNLKSIILKTSFDKVSISLTNITRISTSAAAVLPGLVLYYSFDSDEGDRVKDTSGNGHEGMVVGARYTSNGYVGGACEFDGVGYITVGDIFAPGNLRSNLTVSVWIRTSRYHSPDGSSGMNPIAKQMDTSPHTGWSLAVDPSNKMLAQIVASYPERVTCYTRSKLCDDAWHFLCATYEVDDDWLGTAVYVDGKLNNRAISRGTHASPETSAPLTIGHTIGQEHLPGVTNFKGLLDEVQIYNRTLSADEISSLYDKAVSRHEAAGKGSD